MLKTPGYRCLSVLIRVKTEKMHKYNALANIFGQEYGYSTYIISYVMKWDGMVWYGNKAPQKAQEEN
ncbi:hypothetical protein PAEPH01_0009 [Pancytospora epiphaga]|nr:hypothetical protein PAEPH01_0009 [Pancytospora epiphaga]